MGSPPFRSPDLAVSATVLSVSGIDKMVTVTLTNKQAAVLLKVIDSPSSVDPVLAAIYGKIEQALDAAKRKPGK